MKGLELIFESSETCSGLSEHSNDNLPQIKHQELELDHLSLALLLSSQLEVLGPLDGMLEFYRY